MATLQPILQVADVDASIAFYRDVLGFSVDLAVPDESGKTVHAELSRNGAALMFAPASSLSEAARSLLGAGVTLYITDNDVDIDAFYEQVRAAGARIAEPIQDQFWGDRTFTVQDPDGYHLTFAKNVHLSAPSMMP